MRVQQQAVLERLSLQCGRGIDAGYSKDDVANSAIRFEDSMSHQVESTEGRSGMRPIEDIHETDVERTGAFRRPPASTSYIPTFLTGCTVPTGFASSNRHTSPPEPPHPCRRFGSLYLPALERVE